MLSPLQTYMCELRGFASVHVSLSNWKVGAKSTMTFKVPWCLRSSVEVAGPPSAALH